MFCYNCGIKLDDKASFCPNCGTKLIVDENNSEPAKEPVVVPVTEVAPTAVSEPVIVVPVVTPALQPEIIEYVPSVEEKAKACVKKSFSSVLFLIATILFTLSVILSTISFFTTVDSAPYDAYEEPGVFDKVSVSEYEEEDVTFEDVKLIFGFLEFIDESVLWIIGLFLAFIFAKSKKDMKTGGITTLKVAARIKVIFSFVFAFFIFIMGIALCGTSDPELAFAWLFVAPVCIAVGVLYVLFSFKLSSGISKIRNIAATGVPAKLSGLIGVVLFAIAVLNLLTVNGNVTVTGISYTFNWADSLYALTKGTSCLLFGITFVILKNKLKALAEEYKLANTPAPAGQTIINNNVNI